MEASKNDNVYLEQARPGSNSVWRHLATLILIIALNIIVTTVLILLAILLYGTIDFRQMPEWFVLIVGMAPFAFAALGLYLGVVYIHKRSFRSVLTTAGRLRWRLVWISAAAWFGLTALGDGVMMLLRPGNVYWSFEPARFIPYFFLAILLVPIQAATEELIFRGYLTQAFGLLSRGIWLAWLAPSLLFGLLHGINPEIEAFGFQTMMVYYIGMGLFLGWITLKSGGIELAVGLHVVNNLYASLMVTFPESAIPSPALFSLRQFDPTSGIIVFFLMVGAYMLLIFGLKPRYALVSAALVGIFLLISVR